MGMSREYDDLDYDAYEDLPDSSDGYSGFSPDRPQKRLPRFGDKEGRTARKRKNWERISPHKNEAF